MPPRHERPLQGVLLLVCAEACFAALDTTVKVVGALVSVLLVAWFRYTFQAVATTLVVRPWQHPHLLHTKHPWLHVLRGLLLLTVSLLSFWTVQLMPLAEFTALLMLTPLVVTLGGASLLKEQVGALRWLLVLGGFLGAMLVVRPGSGLFGWVSLLPLLAVAAYAAFQLLTSHLARSERAMSMHLFTGWVGAGLLTLALPWFWAAVTDWSTLALLLGAGVAGTVGHFLLILAFERAPASTLSPYLYAQIGFAMLYGWWFFGHWPDQLALGGIALIVVCGATSAWLAARQVRIPAPDHG